MIHVVVNDNEKRRPNRPTAEFLNNIGIARLPRDVDITFNDARGRVHHFWDGKGNVEYTYKSDRAFHISRVDVRTGETVKKMKIPAFETKMRTCEDIWADLQGALVREFGAVAEGENTGRANRPTNEFLQRVGLSHFPYNVDLSYHDSGVDSGLAFHIRKYGVGGDQIAFEDIPARQTSTNHVQEILSNVRKTLIRHFGAVGKNGWEIPGKFNSAPHRRAFILSL